MNENILFILKNQARSMPLSKKSYILKYAFFDKICYWQLTAVDISMRMTFMYLYNEKAPESAIAFMIHFIEYFLLFTLFIIFKRRLKELPVAIIVQNLFI